MGEETRGGSVTRHDSSLLSSAGISAVYLLVLEIMIFIKPAACSLLKWDSEKSVVFSAADD